MGYPITRYSILTIGCLIVVGTLANEIRKRNRPMEPFTIEYQENSADQSLPFELRCNQAGAVQMLVRTNRGLPNSPVGTFHNTIGPDAASGLKDILVKAPKQAPVSGVVPGEIVRSLSLKSISGNESVWYATESQGVPQFFSEVEQKLLAIRDDALKHPAVSLSFLPLQIKDIGQDKNERSLFFVIYNGGSEPVYLPNPRSGETDETIIELNAMRADVAQEKLSMQDQAFVHIVRKDIRSIHIKTNDAAWCRLEPSDSLVIDCSKAFAVMPGRYSVSYSLQTYLHDAKKQPVSVVELFGEVTDISLP